jgi:KaiC/GvpD/RAD55 family RecA-like ATPase
MITKENALPGNGQGINGKEPSIINNSSFINKIKNILADADVYTAADLDNAKGAEISFLVDNLIPERQVTMITGKPGDGKTTLLFALVAAVLEGGEFAGRITAKKQVVVWDSENSLSTLKVLKDMAGIKDNVLFVKNPPSYRAVAGICNTCKNDCKKTAYDIVAAQYNYDVVFIFDSRTRFEQEDSNTDKTKYLNAFFASLRDKGVTVLLVHHASAKNTDNDSLGSTEIVAGIDNHYKLTAPKQGQKYHLLENKKNRFFKETFSMLLQVSRDPLVVSDVTAEVRESNIAKLAYVIANCTRANQKNIIESARETLNWQFGKIRNVLKEGTGAFWTEEKVAHNETIYTLTEEGQALIDIPTEIRGSNNGCNPDCLKNRLQVHPTLDGLQKFCTSKQKWCVYIDAE